jgi:aminoglycoside phosphotransferase (APT) family kinase protein
MRATTWCCASAEYELLMALPGLPLTVPEPICAPIIPQGGAHPVLVYRRIRGIALCDASDHVYHVDRAAIGASVGQFLRALHAVPLHSVAEPVELARWAEDARVQLRTHGSALDAELIEVTNTLLEAELPTVGPELVLCHRDLGDEHVLLDDDGQPCGIIDFGDAGPSPWWHDLVGMWMWGGDAALAAACSAYGRHLTPDERMLLENHAVAAAAWDVVHTIQGTIRSQTNDAVDELRRIIMTASCRE